MKSYIIRAALHEEATEGWIWMEEFRSRTLVKVTNSDKTRSVICQTRKFDKNFLKIYNDKKSIRAEIKKNERKSTIVMGEWYRDALGGFDTTANSGKEQELVVKKIRCGFRGWATLRAAARYHPDIVVRLGTRLGVLGAGLGILGIASPMVEWFEFGSCSKGIIPIAALAFGILAYFACRTPRPPEEQ
ncbi:MAG TPA: hypothetical protein ENH11_05820 [Candidatus Acetothermia bacterium]|nr:hypothetical protein BMS3Bbin10_02396 [bacterium BMS3Bbin10]HDL85823.1 hypothetical protein [Candidatus Acetothermia bacterium]